MNTVTDYKLAATTEEVKQYIGNARTIAFDYETSPEAEYRDGFKSALDPAKSNICTISISVRPATAIMVPIAHKHGINIDKKEFMGYWRELLSDRNIIKIAHNLVFESMFSYKEGIIIQEPVYDTMSASQMTLKSATEFRKLEDSGLKKLAEELCGEPLLSFEAVTDGRHFDELDPENLETIQYSCADADYALRLYHLFNDWFDCYLPKHRWIVEHIEAPTSVYLGLMKYNGVPMDTKQMDEQETKAGLEMEQIRAEINGMTGDINLGSNCSTAEFRKYLFQELELPVLQKTEKGTEAMDDSVMVQLRDWCNETRPELSRLFELVQEYRKWNKISSTYITGYQKFINPVTGCIHPDFFSLSTDTGRFSCAAPNLQNMPRKMNDPIGVRNFIKAPKGYTIISCDYSQIELRVGAYYCRDGKMMEVYRNGGDIHASTTAVIFNVSYEQALDKHEEDYKERRMIAKNVNFGTFYGLFPKGLQRTLKFKAGIEKTELECAEIIRNLKAGYPGLEIWQEETKLDALRRMYVETKLGRRRYLSDINARDWKKRTFAERRSLNTPIQGTAADIIKLAIGRLLAVLQERPFIRPILQIHDELTFLVPEERLVEAADCIKSCMEQQPFPEFDIPLVAEVSAGKTFGILEELEIGNQLPTAI